jgi:hypothetical protein
MYIPVFGALSGKTLSSQKRGTTDCNKVEKATANIAINIDSFLDAKTAGDFLLGLYHAQILL